MPIQFYRKQNPRTGVADFYEVGTNRYIGPTEFQQGQNFTEVKDSSTIKRNEGGNIEILTNPLDEWKNQTVFMQTAKDIIKQKQRMNQDLTTAKQYWRSLIRDTSPFGGVREPMAQKEGAFTDERMRQLSPTDQASVRASRYAAGSAHLQGLSEEEQYRETQTKDTLQVLQDLWKEKEDLTKQKMDKEQHDLQMKKLRLDIAKAGAESGFELDENGNVVRDLSGADAVSIANAIKQIESGGNYNAKGDSGTSFGAYQYQPGTWTKYSQEYLKSIDGPTNMSLAMTPENQDRVTQFKIQQWLDKGYKADQIAAAWNGGEGILGKDYSRIVGHNDRLNVDYSVPAYVERFKNVLAVNMSQEEEALELTDAKKTGLMQEAGLENKDVKGYTPDDWILLQNTIRDATFEDAFAKVNGEGTEKGWKDSMDVRGLKMETPDPEMIKSKLIEEYGDKLSSTEIDSIMHQSGFVKDDALFTGKWRRAK